MLRITLMMMVTLALSLPDVAEATVACRRNCDCTHYYGSSGVFRLS